MRRNAKTWMEYDELTKPFLPPDSTETATSVAAELRERVVKVEQQVLAQYTATAAYATLAQQGVEAARAESRADLDRMQATLIGLVEKLRNEVSNKVDGLTVQPRTSPDATGVDPSARLALMEDRMNSIMGALDSCLRENFALRSQVDELLQRQMQQEGWLASSGSSSELSLR